MKLDLHYLFSFKNAKWIVIGLIVLFSLLILYDLSMLFFPVTATSTHLKTQANLLPKVKEAASDYILKTPLFGTYLPNQLDERHVKKSMLNVILVGILLDHMAEKSQVIIRNAGGEDNTYKIGDKIPGDAIIKRITAQGVLVERNGTLESLSLPKNDLIFEEAAKPLLKEE